MSILPKATQFLRSEGDPRIVRSGPSSIGEPDRLAKALGWFSIGLGAVELFAPRAVTRTLGMRGSEGLVRLFGLREIGAGVMTLSTEKKVGLWSRVAGDGLDVAMLLSALQPRNPKRHNVAIALMTVIGVTALDVLAAQSIAARHDRKPQNQRWFGNRTGFPNGIEAARGAAKGLRPGSDKRDAQGRAAKGRASGA